MKALELWGGPECTLNRLESGYRDQFAASGHYDRATDLDLFAGLGFAAIRYPVLWEQVAPDDPARCDWRWSDRQLAGLRTRGLRVIAGLVHHGGGPRYTDLLDPEFSTGLATFAGKVAARYPWIRDWTPVNEPLTTARFSALYGHWYPHHRCERSFWLALVNQVDGVRLAMRAIRRVVPDARLIQTEDLGRTYASATMRDQAGFDNTRRWMTWDLLGGRVVRSHPLWARLVGFGLEERLAALADDPCPPSVVGVNHYLTSDRFLDHRHWRYPPDDDVSAGYADIEAVRILEPPPQGLAGAVREAWARYGLPVAVTEVHNGCTRDEQMRWLAAAWDAAVALRGEGVAVEAVTAWSLLGSDGWNTLLMGGGSYEAGVYDLGGGVPRPTAMVPLLQGLAGGATRHPVLAGAGWWRRPIRLEHTPAPRPAPMRDHVAEAGAAIVNAPPLLICGASGTLGQAFARACALRGIPHVLTGRRELDLEDAASIDAALDRHAPWAVINAAGWVRVDEAETHADACWRANATGAVALAQACGRRGVATVQFSSDLVFDGTADRRYVEADPPAPLNSYGRSKAAMESGVGDAAGEHLVIRTAAFFSPADPHNFATYVVRALGAGHPVAASADRIVSPTYVPELVDRALDLLIDGETGIWHLANSDAVSWSDFARRIALACGLDDAPIVTTPDPATSPAARRPFAVPLGSTRGSGLGTLDAAIRHFADHLDR